MSTHNFLGRNKKKYHLVEKHTIYISGALVNICGTVYLQIN